MNGFHTRSVSIGILVLVLLAPITSTVTIQDRESAPPGTPWWGPVDLVEGWGLRVPVVVEHSLPAAIQNLPVNVDVDLGESTRLAGWPVTTVAGRSVLQSFELDTASVRVVEYTNFNLPRSRSTDAQISPFDVTTPGHEAQAVPARLVRGFLDHPQAAPFEPSVNPIVAVQWIAQGTTQPEQPRYYMLYFDIVQNGAKPEQDPERLGRTGVGGLYWTGRGTTVFGVGETVIVTATQPNTRVTVHHYAGRNPLAVSDATLSASASRSFDVGGTAKPWSVTSTAPVVVSSHESPLDDSASHKTGFYPSLDGTLLGSRWNQPVAARDIFVYNPGEQPVRVMADGRDVIVPPHDALTYRRSTRSSPLVVQASGPILVQGSTEENELYPFVSEHGSPVGARLFGTAEATKRNRPDGPLPGIVRAVDLTQSGGAIRVVNLETDKTVLPPPRPNQPFPSASVPPWPASVDLSGGPDTVGPLMVLTLDPEDSARMASTSSVLAWGGPRVHARLPNPPPSLPSAPLGGVGAMDFTAPTPVHVFAYHDATAITVTRVDGSNERFSLDRHQRETVDASLEAPASIRATKPIAVIPDNRIAYGAGFVDAAKATVGPAQFRGFLVSIEPAGGGDEPMVSQISFGETATFELLVRNLGRDTDGTPLPDRVTLSVPALPPGWDATVEPPAIDLGPDGNATVELSVTSPPTRGAGDRAILPVRAVSQGNSNITDEVTTVTLLRERRGVGLWFEEEDGPSEITIRFRPGQLREFPVVVKNLGSAPDTLALSVANVEAGWRANFIDEGTVLRVLELGPGEARGLNAEVRAPSPGGLLLPAGLTFRAISTNDTTVTAKAVLDGLVASESTLELRAREEAVAGRAGEEFVFALELLNQGSSTADVRLNVSGDFPHGWPRPEYRFRGNSLAAVDNRLSSVAPTGVEGIPLELVVRVPPDAPGRSVVRVLATATPAGFGGGSADRLPLNVFVQPFVDVTAPALESVSIEPGATKPIRIRLTNEGNVVALLEPVLLGLPAGWTVNATPHLEIPPHANRTMHLNVSVPRGFHAGTFAPRLGLFQQTRPPIEIGIPIEVPQVVRLAFVGPHRVKLPPGVSSVVDFDVHNEGNVDTPIPLEAAGPEAWHIDLTPREPEIGPGESMRLRARITPPPDASGDVPVRLVRTDKTPLALVHEFTAVSVLPDFALSDGVIRRLGTDGAKVVAQASIRNTGNVTVENVTVALMQGSHILATTVVERVPPVGSRMAVIATELHDLRPGSLSLVVDPEERFIEADETNNRVPVTLAEAGREAPWPASVGFLAVALVGRWLARRRSPGPAPELRAGRKGVN